MSTGDPTPLAVQGHRHVAVAVVLQVRGRAMHVLAWQRQRPPQARRWALPGGALGAEERLGASLARHLAQKVAVRELAHLEQLETRSDPLRESPGRVIATAYLGLIPLGADPDLPPDTAWHPVHHLPPTAFDHASIIESGLARLRAKLSYTNIGFALAPARFTMGELRQVYAAALDREISVTNLHRVLTRRGVIEPVDATSTPGPKGGRPAALYRFRDRQLSVTDPAAMLRDSTG